MDTESQTGSGESTVESKKPVRTEAQTAEESLRMHDDGAGKMNPVCGAAECSRTQTEECSRRDCSAERDARCPSADDRAQLQRTVERLQLDLANERQCSEDLRRMNADLRSHLVDSSSVIDRLNATIVSLEKQQTFVGASSAALPEEPEQPAEPSRKVRDLEAKYQTLLCEYNNLKSRQSHTAVDGRSILDDAWGIESHISIVKEPPEGLIQYLQLEKERNRQEIENWKALYTKLNQSYGVLREERDRYREQLREQQQQHRSKGSQSVVSDEGDESRSFYRSKYEEVMKNYGELNELFRQLTERSTAELRGSKSRYDQLFQDRQSLRTRLDQAASVAVDLKQQKQRLFDSLKAESQQKQQLVSDLELVIAKYRKYKAAYRDLKKRQPPPPPPQSQHK